MQQKQKFEAVVLYPVKTVRKVDLHLVWLFGTSVWKMYIEKLCRTVQHKSRALFDYYMYLYYAVVE